MSELIISVSGLRGIVGETLTPDIACRFVAAYCKKLPAGPIVIGRDGRSSGPMLRSAIIAGITASGRDAIDADVAATPTVGVLVKHAGAAGAVQISASHNPPPYNGIKLFGSDGRVLDATTGAAIRDGFLAGEADWCSFESIGNVTRHDDPHQPHLEKCWRPWTSRRSSGQVIVSCWTAITGPAGFWACDCFGRSDAKSSRSETSPMEISPMSLNRLPKTSP